MSTIISGSGITTPQLDGVVVNQNGVNVADDSELSATLSSANTYTDTQVATKATLSEAQASDIGVNQTWQDVTASRTLGVTYTNTTGKPIEIIVVINASGTNQTVRSYLTIDGSQREIQTAQSSDLTARISLSAIILNNSTYCIKNDAGTGILDTWSELR